MTTSFSEAQEAGDPQTPAARLTLLARHEDAAVRALVAGNPSTSPNVLAMLGHEHWEALIDNPVIPLLLIVRPTWLAELPLRTIQTAVASRQTPLEWLNGVKARHGVLEYAVHQRRHDLVERWARDEAVLRVQPCSPLFFAIEHDQDDTLRLLLDLGISPLVARDVYADGNVHQVELLEEALFLGKLRCARVLLATGAHQSAWLASLRSRAMTLGDAEILRLLHDHPGRS